MKVKHLIEELQKMPQEANIGTFSSDRYDFDYTPIAEIILKEDVELHPDFRGHGKRVHSDWVVLVGVHQKWRGT